MKAYLDNVVASGLARADLPAMEMKAAEAIARAAQASVLEIVTSAESRREQDRAAEPSVRAVLHGKRDQVPRMSDDHKVLGFSQNTDPCGGYVVAPLVTDVVDETLLAQLQAAGLKRGDAYHIMYAAHGRCDWFVTLDERDILPRKTDIEALCAPLRVVRPSELTVSLGL